MSAIGESVDPFDLLDDITNKLAIKAADYVLPHMPKERMECARKCVMGLRYSHERGLIHGDIKPENVFIGLIRSDLSDWGTSKIIEELQKLMRQEFCMLNEDYKDRMRNFVDALQSTNAARIEKQKAENPDLLEKLRDWQIIQRPVIKTATKIKNFEKREKQQPEEVIDQAKIESLVRYLRTEFLPAKSVGYACKQYTKAICDYFWRCDPENLKRACLAFDQRAFAIMLYRFFCAKELPIGPKDTTLYYCELEFDLKQFGLPERAAKLLRKMAEPPSTPFDTTSGQPFPIPCSDEELAELEKALISG